MVLYPLDNSTIALWEDTTETKTVKLLFSFSGSVPIRPPTMTLTFPGGVGNNLINIIETCAVVRCRTIMYIPLKLTASVMLK